MRHWQSTRPRVLLTPLPADMVDATPTAYYYCNPGYYGTSGVVCTCTSTWSCGGFPTCNGEWHSLRNDGCRFRASIRHEAAHLIAVCELLHWSRCLRLPVTSTCSLRRWLLLPWRRLRSLALRVPWRLLWFFVDAHVVFVLWLLHGGLLLPRWIDVVDGEPVRRRWPAVLPHWQQLTVDVPCRLLHNADHLARHAAYRHRTVPRQPPLLQRPDHARRSLHWIVPHHHDGQRCRAARKR